MSDFIIYHNPRCSKSRQTLEILDQHDLETEIILYLDKPLTKEEIESILNKLELSPRDILRKGEDEYKTYNLQDMSLDDSEIIKVMSENPKLIERPIVVSNNQAIIGRPPENVLKLID